MDYFLMVPPFQMKPFREMSKKEAKQHFDWYIKETQIRIEQLKKAYEFTNENTADQLDFSHDSLISLWKWYLDNVIVIDKKKSELNKQKAHLPDWIKDSVGEKKIEDGWISIAMDIAIYFSVCLLKESNSLKWGLVFSPKSLAYVNKPVVTGFGDGKCLDSTNIVLNLTREILTGKSSPEALLDIYKVWLRKI